MTTDATARLPAMTVLALGAAVTAMSTTVGALPALFARRISSRARDTLMGFSAGVMLAATCFSLLVPALGLAADRGLPRLVAGLAVAGLVATGAVFLHTCNRLIPHEHFWKGREGSASFARVRRIWLFVLAIALHNLPEGLAVGSGLGSGDLAIAAPILAGIALQDAPEGFVVAIALTTVGYSVRQGLFVAFVTGVMEFGAAVVGYFGVTLAHGVLPWALAFAGGAMIYVVSDEIIPESHRTEHASQATAGLMFGFVLMMFLDVSLG